MRKLIEVVLFTMIMGLVASAANAAECTKPRQDGCWDLLVLNARFDSSNALMRGLDKPYTSQEERQDRMQELGPRLMTAYQATRVQAAKPRTFLVYVWGSQVSPAAYQVLGRKSEGGKIVAASFEDATGKVAHPKFSKETDLGTPTKVYRIKAESIGASLQFPWNGITGATILICSEDHLQVYPADGKAEAKQGLWIMPAQLAALREYKVPGSIAPFLSSE